MRRAGAVVGLLALIVASRAHAQAQLRLADGTRGTYSELHEALKTGTATGDSVAFLMGQTTPRPLWQRLRAAIAGTAPWNDAIIALTRMAMIAPGAYSDSAKALTAAIERGTLTTPPGLDPSDLLQPLAAVGLEQKRRLIGDAKLRDELLAQAVAGKYGLAEAWTLGRLGAHTSDSLVAHFTTATGEQAKVRWLTLVGFSPDTTLIPFLAHVFAAPDSVGLPLRAGGRASDGLMWIGTKNAYLALREARAKARARGIYADPKLGRGGYDFLDNDSSLVIARTGQWVDAWVRQLK